MISRGFAFGFQIGLIIMKIMGIIKIGWAWSIVLCLDAWLLTRPD